MRCARERQAKRSVPLAGSKAGARDKDGEPSSLLSTSLPLLCGADAMWLNVLQSVSIQLDSHSSKESVHRNWSTDR